MKKHYYIEVTFLVALSIATTAIAADVAFYTIIWEFLGIETTSLNKDIETTSLNKDISKIRMYAFGLVVFLSMINVIKYLHSERRIIKSLLAAAHKNFFRNINIKDSSSQKIYRVTCYKLYKFSFIKTITGILLAIGISIGIYYLVGWFEILIFLILFGFFIYIIDDWWTQFIKSLFRFKKDRFMIIGKDYLLSYVRYGYESGTLNEVNTTIPFIVGKNNRLFAGKVYNSSTNHSQSINHHGINDILRKIKTKMDEVPDNRDSQLAVYRSQLKFSVSQNIDLLKNDTSFKTITSDEQNKVIKFMSETNTLAWDLFDINDIGHSEHFIGFKINGDGEKTWGVVLIDSLSGDNTDFFQYLQIDSHEKWLSLFLDSYSELFSRAISKSSNE